MDAIVIYLIQSALCLAALYLIYWFFLRKDTFFTANRFYLIGSIILSFILPMFKVPVFYEDPQLTYVVVLEAVTVTAQKVETGFFNHINFYQSAFIVYFTGAAIFLIRFVFQLLQLGFLIRKFGVIKKDNFNIVMLDRKYSPFSYFNFIFLNEESLKDKNINEIINHEKIHIKQKHSFDLVLLEMLTILQWFNPFIWFYKMALKGIHEYLADEGLLAGGMDKTSYQHLLLNHTIGLQINNLTNNFNQSLIKKRFIMMTKLQSKKIARLKFLLVLPITALLMVLVTFSCKQKEIEPTIVNVVETENPDADLKTTQPQDNIFAVVENMPEYPGGDEARMKFLANNIKYPKEAREAGIQGVVYMTFVVEKDGSITGAKIMRGIGGGCDEEAIQVVSAMPKWKPGTQRGKPVRVQFNLPIRFTLDEKTINQENRVFAVVEEMPEFVEGHKAVSKFLTENIKYPETARNEGVQGMVYVAFVVEKEGSITGVRVIKGIGSGCDEEAIRVVKMMKFNPGKQNGKAVDVQFNLPIKFSLN